MPFISKARLERLELDNQRLARNARRQRYEFKDAWRQAHNEAAAYGGFYDKELHEAFTKVRAWIESKDPVHIENEMLKKRISELEENK